MISAVVFVCALAFLIVRMPSYIADKSYNKAVNFEKAYDYENALKYYAKIKENDSRYGEVSLKIVELNRRVEKNKAVADAFIALKNVTGIETLKAESLEGICMSEDARNVAFTVDGIGYIVTDTAPEENRYFTSALDSEKNLYVVTYKPSSTYKGWLSNIADSVKQEASNLLYKSNISNYSGEDIQLQVYKQYIEAE